MRCLVCHQEIIPEVNWSTFWKLPSGVKMCSACSMGLEKIQVPGCPFCHRPEGNEVCGDCVKWKESNLDALKKNISVFQYNDFSKELVARWKYRGDYVLMDALQQEIDQKWKASRLGEWTVVSVPLSKEREKERGFNQSEAIIRMISEQPTCLFQRKDSEKQSKRGKKERMNAENPFLLQEPVSQPVVIVDDIYTTGTTVRHMASLLREQGCPSVHSFTIFR